MANSNSTQDLVKGALFKAGEQTDGSSPYHPLALKAINDSYLSILAGASEFDPDVSQVWSWARKQRSLTILPPYQTGTISVVNGSLNGTFSVIPQNLAPQNISLQGYFLNVTDQCSWYQIATHVAGSLNFTLDAPYIETTNALAGFILAPLQYDLGPNILRLAEPFRIYVSRQVEFLENYEDTGRIYSCSLDQLRESFPIKFLQNDTPSMFATLSQTDTSWVIQFNKYATYPMKIDLDTIEIPAGLVDTSDSVPLFPRAFRQLLEFAGAFHVLLEKGNDEKAQANFTLAKQFLQAMKNADVQNISQTSKTFGRIIPRTTGYIRCWSSLR